MKANSTRKMFVTLFFAPVAKYLLAESEVPNPRAGAEAEAVELQLRLAQPAGSSSSNIDSLRRQQPRQERR